VRFAVTEEHVLVPRSESGTLAVHFDEAYVWSFTTPRDGHWRPGGWKVPWPTALRDRLDGTALVSLEDEEGARFEKTISFAGNPEPLALVDKNGHPLAIDNAQHLTRVFSETSDDVRGQIIEGTRRALADLRADGYDAHLSYGCLLGAVRDGRMIGHDSDADLAYLSRYQHPTQIITESYDMERSLRRRGWRLIRMSNADLKLFHPLPDGREVHIDVFGAFHVGDTFYQLGGRSGLLPRSALTPAGTIALEGVELPAPADPEAVLGFLYGASWRTPDPAFQSIEPRAGLDRLHGWMRGFRDDVPAWNEYYTAHNSTAPTEPSSFAVWTLERVGTDAPIVDLGCGNGRDSALFLQQATKPLAYDFSRWAVHTTRGRFTRAGIDGGSVNTLNLNERRSVLVTGAELSRTPEPVNLYARQLLGCLDAEATDLLWVLCSMALRRGGSLFLEFSALRGPELSPSKLVERLDVDSVVAGISARGGIIDEVVVGPGVDYLDRPDRKVARIVAHWPQVSSSALGEEES
jgi:hypothetical protein